MARKHNDSQLDELLEAIQANPEQKAGWLARFLGRDNKSVIRNLSQLEERGDLLLEDNTGHISWFGRRS